MYPVPYGYAHEISVPSSCSSGSDARIIFSARLEYALLAEYTVGTADVNKFSFHLPTKLLFQRFTNAFINFPKFTRSLMMARYFTV